MSPNVRLGDHSASNSTNILVGVCGYEGRSTAFVELEEIADYHKILVFDYCVGGKHSYDKNKEKLHSLDSSKIRVIDSLSSLLKEIVNIINMENLPNTHFVLDISSMDRRIISELFLCFFREETSAVCVTLIYHPQLFHEPEYNKLDTVVSFGPVVPELSGSSGSSSQKLALILGAGYDAGKVVGSIDSLEPDEVYVFRPVSKDVRFERAVDKANGDFEFLTGDMSLIDYRLGDPYLLFNVMHSMLQAKHLSHRVFILPMGPKLFAAVSILLALMFHPHVRVWRYSTIHADFTDTHDATASGEQYRLSFQVETGI